MRAWITNPGLRGRTFLRFARGGLGLCLRPVLRRPPRGTSRGWKFRVCVHRRPLRFRGPPRLALRLRTNHPSFPRLNHIHEFVAPFSRRRKRNFTMRKRIALAAALVTWPVLGFAQEKPAPAQASSGQTQAAAPRERSEEHTSELQSLAYLVCRLLLEKKKKKSDTSAYADIENAREKARQ